MSCSFVSKVFDNFNNNEWQSIIGILKNCLQFSLSPYTMLQTHNIPWRMFCSLFLNIVKRREGVEIKNFPNSSFSHNFCHNFSVWNFSVARFKWNWRHALTHYVTNDVNLNNFWNPNKQLKYQVKWGKIFSFQIFFR